jgi:hypothetical protein
VLAIFFWDFFRGVRGGTPPGKEKSTNKLDVTLGVTGACSERTSMNLLNAERENAIGSLTRGWSGWRTDLLFFCEYYHGRYSMSTALQSAARSMHSSRWKEGAASTRVVVATREAALPFYIPSVSLRIQQSINQTRGRGGVQTEA